MLTISILLAAAVITAESSSTATAIIRQNASSSLLWKTVTAPVMEVMLEWPKDAAKVVVAVDDAVKATVEDSKVTSVEVNFSLPSDESEERMVELVASYFDKDGIAIKETKATLALVCGVCAGPVRHRSAGSYSWRKIRSKSAVLPIPENIVSLEFNGESVLEAPAAPGWYWWKQVPSTSASLSAVAGDGSQFVNYVSGLAGLSVILK